MSYNIWDPLTKRLIPIAGNNEASTSSLEGLSNVSIFYPTDGQIIQYDAQATTWVNRDLDISVEGLTDAEIEELKNAQRFVYDGTKSKWVNIDDTLANLSDTLVDAPAGGDMLRWDSENGKWVNVRKEDLIYVGATSENDGVFGFVPSAENTEKDNFLRGDGSWIAIDTNKIIQGYYISGSFYEDITHTVLIDPDPTKIYIDLIGNAIYRYDNGYEQIGSHVEDMVGATAIGGGTHGLVPAPTMFDTNRFLKGNGTWAEVPHELSPGFGIKIQNDVVSTTDFVGTRAQWDELTNEEKAEFDFIYITDDSIAQDTQPGHAIIDAEGVEKTQREKLQFVGLEVTDDDANGVTKVAEVPYTAGYGIDITNKEISVDDNMVPAFVGTREEWEALTIDEKAQYEIVNFTNDLAGGEQVVVDEVSDGNLNPVTSNAVFDFVKTNLVAIDGTLPSAVETTGQLFAMPSGNYMVGGYKIDGKTVFSPAVTLEMQNDYLNAYLSADGSGLVSKTITVYLYKIN